MEGFTPLRTPLRSLSRPDASAIWAAYTRIWAAIFIVVILAAVSLVPGNAVTASSWSDASTWTVVSSVPDSTDQIARTCSFTGSLTFGASTCTTTMRTGPPPAGIAAGPGPAYSAFGGTYWGIWTTFGCDASFNDSQRCEAIRLFLGYSLYVYILQSLVLLIAIAGLLQVSEALLQMYFAPEDKLQALRVPNLWKWFVPLMVLTGFIFCTWPIVVVVALQKLKEDTIKFSTSGPDGTSPPGGGPPIVNIASQSTLVRPGSSWWFVLISFGFLVYAQIINRMLEKAFPHPET